MNLSSMPTFDRASVQSAWQDLNKLVPLGAITSERDYKRRVSVMDELLDRIGANESHRLMPLLDLVTKEVEAYEAKQQKMPEAAPAQVLAYLMEEHGLKQADLTEELGGKRELNARQVKTLAARFNVSPAVFFDQISAHTNHGGCRMNAYTEPNFAKSALITIDTQFDTLDGQPLEIAGTSAALPNIRSLLNAYRQHRLPIIHIVRIYKRDGSNVDLCRKQAVEEGAAILLEGSAGCELAPDLFGEEVRLDFDLLLSGSPQEIGGNEVIIYKPRWGAFFNTPLESHLKSRGIDTLVFTGCNFPNCPRTSIYEASERDYKIVLAEDAVSGLYPKGKEEMSNIGVHLLKTASIESAIMSS